MSGISKKAVVTVINNFVDVFSRVVGNPLGKQLLETRFTKEKCVVNGMPADALLYKIMKDQLKRGLDVVLATLKEFDEDPADFKFLSGIAYVDDGWDGTEYAREQIETNGFKPTKGESA